MRQADTLQRFMFENADIRGEIAHCQQSFQTIMQQHHYPPQIQQLLGEVLLAALLLTSTIKFKGQLTLQFYGKGPIEMLVAKCDDQFHIRALAQFDPGALDQSLMDAFNAGKLVVTIQPDDKPKPYQSIIPIAGKSIAQCLEDYFAQSEQIPTRIWFAVNDDAAAGMLIQLLPGEQNTTRENFWSYATKIGETITDKELLALDNQTILHRLYHEEDIRIFEPSPVSFRCSCSIDAMKQAILLLGKAEAEQVLSEKQVLEVVCEYCNHSYTFDKVDVAEIFHGQT